MRSAPQTAPGQASGQGDLIDLVSLDAPLVPAPVPAWYSLTALMSWTRAKWPILLFVATPTLFGGIYFLFVAADRYETDARFVVKSPNSAAASQLSGIMAGSGVIRSTEDAYIVHAYMQSRDAARTLARDVDLVARLQRPEADWFWTYPGLFRKPSEERTWQHLQHFVALDFDSSTGITTLSVTAFRPDDARQIAEALLVNAEKLINNMGERAQKETLQSAEREVENSRARAREALERVTAFRRRTSLIDPSKSSNAALETMTGLAVEIARSKAELTELSLSSPDSPQATTLKRRIVAFEQQVGVERTALTGSDTSIAPLIAEYERLMLEREFAERTFGSSLTALEIARLDGERQRLYLERISTPAIVDYPKHPRRILNMLIVLIASYMLFSIGRNLLSDTLSHADK